MLKGREKLISKLLVLAMCTSLMSTKLVFADETETTSAQVTSIVSTTGAAVSVSTDTTEESKTLHPGGCIPDSKEKIASMQKAKTTLDKAVNLPSSVDLSSNLPSPGDQGDQGSCVAWATAYAYKSFQEKLDHNWNLNTNDHLFSPAYVYNQINHGVDEGAYISDGLNLLVTQGCCSLKDMPYNENNYTTQPNAIQNQEASEHKALSCSSLSSGDVSQIKAHLADKDAVVVGIPVYPDFDNISNSNQVYDVTTGNIRCYHAICLVGYDDSKQAFKFINSWGTNWGLSGYGYMSYDLVSSLNTDSYIMTDIDEVAVTDVTLNNTSLNVVQGNTSTLTATVLPSNVSYNTVTWSSSNTNVATVSSSGVVTGVRLGSATITCTSMNDESKSAACSVTVKDGSDFTFDSKTGSINKYKGTDTTVVIPNTINGVPVKIIGSGAFNSCSSITSITIPDSVTSIGDGVFQSCSRLTSINIPNNVTSIGMAAFAGCTNLTSITIPNSVTSIGAGSFAGCTNLTSITIPKSLTSIGIQAFISCTNATFYVKSEVTKNLILNSSSGISSSKIVLNIESDFTFDSTTGTITKYNGTDTTVVIPSTINGVSVTSIGYEAFENCSNITSITIPSGVTSIGAYAFSGCSRLTSIAIPSGVTSIGVAAFSGCSSLTSITIPDSVTSIGDVAFSSCSSITSITIPTGVTRIGTATFNGCTSLTSINIPTSVTSIGMAAFGLCTNLTSIIIPTSVTSIGYAAFSSCSSLISITIPISVTSIGDHAFSSCTNATFYVNSETTKNLILNSISDISSSKIVLKSESDYTFDSTTGTITKYNGTDTTVVIPSTINGVSVTSIGHAAFANYSSVTSITIPNSVTSIGRGAFFCCSSAKSITIPNSVISIGNYAFYGCSSLTSITIPTNVTSIGESTFNNCSSLTSITIPTKVTSIGLFAFDGCSSLTSIIIPNSVTSMGNCAFYGCSSLTSITIPTSVASIGQYAFSSCSNATFYVKSEATKNLILNSNSDISSSKITITS